jgi:hypothetical protein
MFGQNERESIMSVSGKRLFELFQTEMLEHEVWGDSYPSYDLLPLKEQQS